VAVLVCSGGPRTVVGWLGCFGRVARAFSRDRSICWASAVLMLRARLWWAHLRGLTPVGAAAVTACWALAALGSRPVGMCSSWVRRSLACAAGTK
jgi:endonuclease/exonuclease/phosphatase (EEP) superfamily protein YafD